MKFDFAWVPRRSAIQASLMRRRTAAAMLVSGVLAMSSGAALAQELFDLEKIKASGTLKVGVYKDFAPFSDVQDGAIKGLDVSIAQALADKLGLKLSLLPFPAGENMNDDLRNMVWKGHYLGYGPADVLMHVPVERILIDENPQTLIFAAYMREQPVLMYDGTKLSSPKSPDDLVGLPLAAESGSGAASMLMGQHGGMLREQVKVFDSGMAAAQAVLDGKVAAAFVMRAQAEAVIAKQAAKPANIVLGQMMIGAMPTRGWPVGVAIKSKNKALGQAIDAAMKELQASGEMLKIFQAHGVTLTTP